ncbi:hypothetical protein PCC8801_2199 [Rippkaea orientalis PCC 8801]|uniref:Uncharacterized protein n=1 Tax=Rippkaea orientalis (strain PCC 8801 / RF-1) TaxID=41431 RepID=B7K080_RIPO1|nr:hypothetical protein [Rippkaea orientalis]ACK66227.1 hypothetical protein PCC8801_2199 [Rippkaea orientalis PCC 8801]
MSSPKLPPTTFRVRNFLAGLKPLGSLVFLAPVVTVALLAVGLWQYRLHPEWLGNITSPVGTIEGEVGNNLDIGINPQNVEGNTPITNPQSSLPPQENNLDIPLPSPLGLADPQIPVAPQNLPELPPASNAANPPSSPNKQQLPQIFQPLLPHVKNPNSLSPSLSGSGNTSQPVNIPNLKPIEIAPIQTNPLYNAMQQNALPSGITPPSNPLGNTSVNPSPSSINQPTPTGFNQVPTQPQYSQVPRQSMVPSYQAYPGNPNGYSTPYNQSVGGGYPNGYGVPTTPVQPVQPINPYGYGTPQGYNQPTAPQNNYGMQRPQISGSDSVYSR